MLLGDRIRYLYQKISYNSKVVFVVAMVIGWITHFMIIANRYANEDDNNNIVTSMHYVHLGRWCSGLI